MKRVEVQFGSDQQCQCKRQRHQHQKSTYNEPERVQHCPPEQAACEGTDIVIQPYPFFRGAENSFPRMEGKVHSITHRVNDEEADQYQCRQQKAGLQSHNLFV